MPEYSRLVLARPLKGKLPPCEPHPARTIKIEDGRKMNFSYTVIAGDDFIQEVVKCPTPTVAFFVAKWSGNCHMMEPIIARLAKRFEGQIKFCKVDADNAGAITRAYSITELPTLLFFASGTPQSRINGLASESEISKKIESLLISKPRKDRD